MEALYAPVSWERFTPVLNRPKRPLSLANIRARAAYFHVPADVFMVPDPDDE